jgi:hypothetical protein
MPVSPQQNSGGSELAHPSSLLPNHGYGPFPRPNDIRRREHLQRYHPIVAGSLVESWLESPEPVYNFPQTPKRREISFLRPNDIRRIKHVYGFHPVVPKAQHQRGLQRQQLKYKTISGSSSTDPWEIQWSLTHNTKKGGWIVQHFVADFAGFEHYDYWEAWPVSPGSHVPSTQGIDTNLRLYSDMFAGPPRSHGHGSAAFYEGLRLPDSFTVHPRGFPAGILRATTVDPKLPTANATAPVVRWWKSP